MSTTVNQDSREVNEILAKSFGELKAYDKKYSKKNIGVIIIGLIILFFGLSIYFQMCSGAANGCSPVGFIGSSVNRTGTTNDNDYLNGDVVINNENEMRNGVSTNMFTLLEGIALIMIIGSVSLLTAYSVTMSNASKLASSGDVMGAMIINPTEKAFTDKNAADNMLKNQLNVLVDKYRSETGNIDNVEMIKLLNEESFKPSYSNKMPEKQNLKNHDEFPGNSSKFSPKKTD
jgi:type II secretory pathway pseudopilin PulG